EPVATRPQLARVFAIVHQVQAEYDFRQCSMKGARDAFQTRLKMSRDASQPSWSYCFSLTPCYRINSVRRFLRERGAKEAQNRVRLQTKLTGVRLWVSSR